MNSVGRVVLWRLNSKKRAMLDSLDREDTKYLRSSLYDVIHGDPHVAFVIDAFSIADEQYLGGFVFYEEHFDDPVGDGPVADEVKVVEINGFRLARSFQATF